MRLTIYNRMRYAVKDEDETIKQETEDIIKRHQEANGSQTVLKNLFKVAGSKNYHPQDLFTIKLEKIVNNRDKKYTTIGKSLSQQELTNWAVYLKSKGKMSEPLGKPAVLTLVKAGLLGHIEELGALNQSKDFAEAKRKQEEQAIIDYVTSNFPQQKQQRKERMLGYIDERKRKTGATLEDYLKKVDAELAAGFSTFITNLDAFTLHGSEANYLSRMRGSIPTQLAQQPNLREDIAAALQLLKEKDVIVSNEDYATANEKVLDYWSLTQGVDKHIMLGDIIEDLKQIAVEKEELLAENTKGRLATVNILTNENPLATFAERQWVLNYFDVYKHRKEAYDELIGDSDEYAQDYEEGFNLSKQLFRKGPEWKPGTKKSPPTKSLFKNMPLMAGYKLIGDEQLTSIMDWQEAHHINGDDTINVVESQTMQATAKAIDAVVLMGRKARIIKESLEKADMETPVEEQDRQAYDHAKAYVGYLRSMDTPIERFEQKYGISPQELRKRLADRPFEKKRGYETTIDERIERLVREAEQRKMYVSEEMQEIATITHAGKNALEKLKRLEKTTTQDKKNYQTVQDIRVLDDFLITSGLPYYEELHDYLYPEEKESLRGYEWLAQELSGAAKAAGEAGVKALQQYSRIERGSSSALNGTVDERIRKSHTSQYLKGFSKGTPPTKYVEAKDMNAFIEETSQYVPLTEEVKEAGIAVFSFKGRRKAGLTAEDAVLNKNWGAFKNARAFHDYGTFSSGDYIQQELANKVMELYGKVKA